MVMWVTWSWLSRTATVGTEQPAGSLNYIQLQRSLGLEARYVPKQVKLWTCFPGSIALVRICNGLRRSLSIDLQMLSL